MLLTRIAIGRTDENIDRFSVPFYANMVAFEIPQYHLSLFRPRILQIAFAPASMEADLATALKRSLAEIEPRPKGMRAGGDRRQKSLLLPVTGGRKTPVDSGFASVGRAKIVAEKPENLGKPRLS